MTQFGPKTAKPGIKTTEFWASLIAQLVGIAALFGWLTPDRAGDVQAGATAVAGGLLQGLSAFGYSLARGNAKKNKDA